MEMAFSTILCLSLAAAAWIAAVGAALMLWRKNKLLAMQNKCLIEKNRQIALEKEEEHRQRMDCEEKLRIASEMQNNEIPNDRRQEGNADSNADGKYSHSSLNNEQRETLISRIQDILNTPDIICKQDFNLGKLAKLTESNTTYVSQVVNETYNSSFSNVLGQLRVREACRRMDDEQAYANVTIEAISISVGFKSRTAFINAFKRETGVAPSEYQRLKSAGKSVK